MLKKQASYQNPFSYRLVSPPTDIDFAHVGIPANM